MVLIGSHYDTVQTSPGVDDNGSGMTALLQALKLFTSLGAVTLLFFSFVCEVTDGPSSRCEDFIDWMVFNFLLLRESDKRSMNFKPLRCHTTPSYHGCKARVFKLYGVFKLCRYMILSVGPICHVSLNDPIRVKKIHIYYQNYNSSRRNLAAACKVGYKVPDATTPERYKRATDSK